MFCAVLAVVTNACYAEEEGVETRERSTHPTAREPN